MKENKCLHCGKNEPGYCEECYQELIGENAKLQVENKNYKTLYINIQGVRTGKQLLKKYINDSILKSEIREKLEKAEKKIKHYKAARGSGKPIQTHIKLVRLITEVEIYKELLNIK